MTVDFKELLRNQRLLQEKMGWPGGVEIDLDRRFQVNPLAAFQTSTGFRNSILAAIVELTEALNETTWKYWKPDGYKQVDKEKLATEMTDVLQFWANAALAAGLTADDLSRALRVKWGINKERVENGETTRGSE